MMKNKIFAVLFIFLAVLFFHSQKLNFKDKNFRKAVTENYDFNKDGFIDKGEAFRVSNLFLVQREITSAEDLIFFPNAKMIVIDDNAIPNINYGHIKARGLGYQSIILIGHENYYPKFGYKKTTNFEISFPFDVPEENGMAIELVKDGLKNIKGMVKYPKEFGIY